MPWILALLRIDNLAAHKVAIMHGRLLHVGPHAHRLVAIAHFNYRIACFAHCGENRDENRGIFCGTHQPLVVPLLGQDMLRFHFQTWTCFTLP